jgi:hypothetical protein
VDNSAPLRNPGLKRTRVRQTGRGPKSRETILLIKTHSMLLRKTKSKSYYFSSVHFVLLNILVSYNGKMFNIIHVLSLLDYAIVKLGSHSKNSKRKIINFSEYGHYSTGH